MDPGDCDCEYESDFARAYYCLGKAAGEASAILIILRARGMPVSDDARDRITACTDLRQLETWLRHAATAITADQLLRR
jgi:hypothetical protein